MPIEDETPTACSLPLPGGKVAEHPAAQRREGRGMGYVAVPGRADWIGSRTSNLPEPFFLPHIGLVVIPRLLPESTPIVRHELQ